jgi:hypothetical protein
MERTYSSEMQLSARKNTLRHNPEDHNCKIIMKRILMN